jgi:2-polyprenyl-6-methoxyphenol hydroxylase-like FAD-dependent oxidoreductase
MDVLWIRLSRRSEDPGQTLGRVDTGRIFVMLNREDYWQCAYVIAKGGFDEIRARGLPALRQEIAGLAPYLRDRVDELKDWSDVKLLSVSVDRLRAWHRPGLLCIGDAAHAMSPIGGVGINLGSRTRSPPRTFSPRGFSRVRFRSGISRPCSAAASFRRARRSGSRWSCRNG